MSTTLTHEKPQPINLSSLMDAIWISALRADLNREYTYLLIAHYRKHAHGWRIGLALLGIVGAFGVTKDLDHVRVWSGLTAAVALVGTALVPLFKFEERIVSLEQDHAEWEQHFSEYNSLVHELSRCSRSSIEDAERDYKLIEARELKTAQRLTGANCNEKLLALARVKIARRLTGKVPDQLR